MDGYFLDTNIVTYWHNDKCRQHKAIIHHVTALPNDTPLWISVVTLGEIRYGHGSVQAPDVEIHRAFSDFVSQRLPIAREIDRHTALIYGDIRARLFSKYSPKSQRKRRWPEELVDPASSKMLGIQENDLWIAAQALQFDFVLVTNDKMKRICEVAPELRVENWAI